MTRVCDQSGCTSEAHFRPYVILWAKEDPLHECGIVGSPAYNAGRRKAMIFIDIAFCPDHATTRREDFELDPNSDSYRVASEKCGGTPDLDTMVIQYLGNVRFPWEVTEEALTTGRSVMDIMREKNGLPPKGRKVAGGSAGMAFKLSGHLHDANGNMPEEIVSMTPEGIGNVDGKDVKVSPGA